MRFRKKDEKNLVKVGIFISALTAVLMVMIVSIGKENSIFNQKVNLISRVDDVKNLKPGCYVELKGIRIGTVNEINIISNEEVEIVASVLESEIQWIKQDSKVSISTAGLVGDKYLEIYSGSKDAPTFNPDKDILKSENLADMKQIITKGESIATITERILTRFDLILYNMDDGKKIIETVNSLNRASVNIEKISKELADAQVGQTVKNINSSMAKLEKTANSAEKIMARIEKGPGTLNSMIFDNALHEDLRALLGGASRNKVIKYFIRESIKKSESKQPNTDE